MADGSVVINSINSEIHFTLIDYGIFAAMLILSSLIGVYYGFIAKTKQDNTVEYLLGGKQMTLIPIAVSLIVTHISGITMLGIPTEIYAYGAQFWLSIIPAVLLTISLNHIFLPVFYELKLLSTFMYLEQRYNRKVRLVASGVSTVGSIFIMAMFVYIPALAFNQVSGVNVHIVTSVLCAICVFYTTIGGLRAVVWTDAIQSILMIAAVFAVIVLGLLNLKYPMDMFSIADDGERLILFNTNPSPFVRSSVWTVLFGLSFYWISCFGCSQSCIQKLMCLPDIKSARRAIWIFGGGIIVFNLTAVLVGLIMYANFYDCDPFTAGFVNKLDQVVPYFVMRIGGKIPGLPGVFIAGLFSGGLSSLSGLLNTLSCMIYDDFLRNRLQNKSEKTVSNVLKLIVLVIGVINLGLIFFIEKLSTVFELTLALYSVAGGAVFGLFTTGMLCPRINTKGAVCGAITSVIFVLAITIGSQSRSKPITLPMRTDGCDALVSNWNMTTISPILLAATPETAQDEQLFWLFKVSFMYFTMIGCLTVWIVAYPISLLTQSGPEVDDSLLAPFLRRKANIKDETNSVSDKITKF